MAFTDHCDVFGSFHEDGFNRILRPPRPAGNFTKGQNTMTTSRSSRSLGWLGFLGFLGFLGTSMGAGFYGFFGFFAFFAFFGRRQQDAS